MDTNFGSWLYSVCGTVILVFVWLYVIFWISQLASFIVHREPGAQEEDDLL